MTEKDKALEQLDINENTPAEEEKVIEESPAEKAEEGMEEAVEAAVEPEAEETEAEEEAETSEEEGEEEVKVYEPHEKKAEEAPALISEQQNADSPKAEPQRQNITPAVQYSKSLERERKIAQEVKKRQRRPMVFILAMCALLIVLAIIVNAVLKDLDGGHASPTPIPTQTVIVPSPTVELPQQPEASYVPIVEATEEPTAPKSSTYEIFKEDISWTAARDKCIEMGGHLAVISTQEEFDRVVAIAKTQGVEKLWIGCQRVNGNMVWVTDDLVEYYPWAKGEPTGYDSFDGAAEDYVLLWNNNGWYYNDSRNDPAAEFPQWYSGTIGYICEFEE